MGRGDQWHSAIVIAAAWIVASGLAAATLALLMGGISFFTTIFLFVVVVSGVLGMPIYLATRARRNDTPVVAAVMGFVVGAAFPAILIFGGPAVDEASSGGTATVINGSYTAAGWLENFAFIGFFGLIGVAGALVFSKLVGRRATVEVKEGASTAKRQARAILLAAAAVGVILMAFAIPRLTADRSCHNPLRDGRTGIGTAASFDLSAGVDQWQKIEREVDAFGREGNWSVRSDVRTDGGFPWFQISLCKEPGTDILVQGMPDGNSVIFSVMQPQGGTGWQTDFRMLHDRISGSWPNKVSYRDIHGMPIGAPAWVGSQRKQ